MQFLKKMWLWPYCVPDRYRGFRDGERDGLVGNLSLPHQGASGAAVTKFYPGGAGHPEICSPLAAVQLGQAFTWLPGSPPSGAGSDVCSQRGVPRQLYLNLETCPDQETLPPVPGFSVPMTPCAFLQMIDFPMPSSVSSVEEILPILFTDSSPSCPECPQYDL